MDPMSNRRDALLSLGGLATAWAIPTLAQAHGTPAKKGSALLTWTPKGLTPAQARTLEAGAELIMPATDTPGAREAKVPQFVDRAVATYCPAAQAEAIRAGLDRLDSDARAARGRPFASLTLEDQTRALSRHDGTARRSVSPAPAGRGDTETGLSSRAAKPAPAPMGPDFFPILRELVTVGYFTSQLGATKAVRYDPVPGPYRGCVPLSQIGRAWAL